MYFAMCRGEAFIQLQKRIVLGARRSISSVAGSRSEVDAERRWKPDAARGLGGLEDIVKEVQLRRQKLVMMI